MCRLRDMKKYLFLIALWFIFLVPISANAAAKFLVLCTTTCTWDNTNDAIWSTSSGGTNNTTHPVAGDDVTLDASSCVGGVTCTITTGAVTISIVSLTMSLCTASTTGCILDASANNTNFTLSSSTNAFVSNGSGTRTLNMGNGTWTLSGVSAIWNAAGSTNFTLNANSSTIAFTGTANGQRELRAGTAKTYNNITVNSSVDRFFQLSGATAIGINTLTITGPNRVQFQQGITTTITTLSNISGNATNQCLLTNNNPSNGQATISSGNNFTADYCAISGLAFTGAGTFAATNSMNVGQATGIAITLPSGSGATPKTIGG